MLLLESCLDELSETCRVSCQNKFVKIVHLVGFTIKKLDNTVYESKRATSFDLVYVIVMLTTIRKKTHTHTHTHTHTLRKTMYK
jgi:hypothetical protein